jgi:hypothetical protein
MNQEDLRARLLIELEGVAEDATAIVSGLADPQLHWSPATGWSIGQVLEHLVLTADAYVSRVRGRVYSPKAAHVLQGVATWEPSLMGWLLVKGMRSQRKFPAPKVFAPGPAPRPDVVEAFHQRQRTLTQLLLASAALDWNRVRTTSPASPMIRLNLGDVFTILLTHTQRHVHQMERVRDRVDFPAESKAS